MNILVTGAQGQLGHALRRVSGGSGNEWYFSDVLAGEDVVKLDMTDKEGVEAFVLEKDIKVIINCAAYTNVEKAEDDEGFAYKLNAEGPAVLAAAAVRNDALLIHVSTDYVFDGKGYIPYREDMQTAPVSAYGRTKLAGEEAVAASGCRYMIFRTAWLYYDEGKNFVEKMLELTASRPMVKVVFDQVGTPTYALDLAELIYLIVEDNLYSVSGIWHYSNEGVCSWYDFAREICYMAGHLCDVQPCRTEEFPTKAARPHFSVLDKTKVKVDFGVEIPHWKDSLTVYMMNKT